MKEIKNVKMPEMVVMKPMVENVSNPVSENVSLEEFDTELGVIIQKMDDVNLDYQNTEGK